VLFGLGEGHLGPSPGVALFIGGQRGESTDRLGLRLDHHEPVTESPRGVAQLRLGVTPELASGLHPGEEQVTELMGGRLGAQLGEFVVDVGESRGQIRHAKALCCSLLLHFEGIQKCGQGFGNALRWRRRRR